MSTSEHRTVQSGMFATTHWTQVLEARGATPQARAALSDLCSAYYAPVFAFVRRNSSNEESARDSTQAFFASLLARGGIDAIDPHRGRFRSFLLGAVKNFLADRRDHANRLKRGGGRIHEPLDAATDTSPGLEIKDDKAPSPEREFDRKWALTVLDHALATLAAEHLASGKQQQFELLKPWLSGEGEGTTQAELASELGMNEGAAKVAIHRLRKRFREIIKAEIARTVGLQDEVNSELSYLLEALF